MTVDYSIPKTLRALIVDDEWTARQLTQNALGDAGIECHIAGNGSQALESVKQAHYDVVITDLLMPGGNGHQLCLDLLKLPKRPLIVVLTGISETKLGADLLKRGIDDVEYKPVDYKAFALKVQTLLSCRHRSESDNSRIIPRLNGPKIP